MGYRKAERIITGLDPLRLQTSGISCRAGVGGRRGRKRERAREKRGNPLGPVMDRVRPILLPYLFKRDSVRDPVR